MRAVTWQGKRDVRVETVPDPAIKESTDVIVKITSTGICGSDLHLYEVLGPYMAAGRRPRSRADGRSWRRSVRTSSGVVPGDRVVVPFQISCGHCFMCDAGLTTQCETTQVREEGTGAALFGYSKMYGSVPGGQAEYLRVPHAQNTTIKVPEGPPGRPVRVPLRRAAHRVAGGAVRRRARRRHPRGAGTRSDRRHGHSDRAPPGAAGHRGRPRRRASASGPGTRRRGPRPARRTTTIWATRSGR